MAANRANVASRIHGVTDSVAVAEGELARLAVSVTVAVEETLT